MIDIENEVFDAVEKEAVSKYPGLKMDSLETRSPASFPFASLVQKSNVAWRRSRTSTSNEEHAAVMFELNVYSNKWSGKKAECKKIAAIINDKMQSLGFTRAFLEPTPNTDDATVYRMTGRYQGIVSKDKKIYRR